MILIDKRVCKAALRLSKKSYSAVIQHADGENSLLRVGNDCRTVLGAKRLRMDPVDLAASIERLIASGHLREEMRYMGGMFFSITPLLRHRFAFFLDRFSKKFLAGFLSGVTIGLTVNLLTGYAQSAVEALLQWLRSL